MAKIEQAQWQVSNTVNALKESIQRKSIFGLTTQRVTGQQVRVHPGWCASEDALDLISLSASINKDLGFLWTAGNNNGGRDTGSLVNGWWHVFVIKNPTTGVVDALFSLSPTAPTLPNGFTLFRRVFTFYRSGSGIDAYRQHDDEFFWFLPVAHVVAGIPANSAHALLVPTGIRVMVKGILSAGRAGTTDGQKALTVHSTEWSNWNAVGAPDTPDFRGVAGSRYANGSFSQDNKGTASYIETMSDLNAQVEIDGSGTSSNDGVFVVLGWRDFRGKDY